MKSKRYVRSSPCLQFTGKQDGFLWERVWALQDEPKLKRASVAVVPSFSLSANPSQVSTRRLGDGKRENGTNGCARERVKDGEPAISLQRCVKGCCGPVACDREQLKVPSSMGQANTKVCHVAHTQRAAMICHGSEKKVARGQGHCSCDVRAGMAVGGSNLAASQLISDLGDRESRAVAGSQQLRLIRRTHFACARVKVREARSAVKEAASIWRERVCGWCARAKASTKCSLVPCFGASACVGVRVVCRVCPSHCGPAAKCK